MSLEKMVAVCERSRILDKTIVFTNGCFDMLHDGHIRSLNKAKELGDVLIVGLNSDSSVRRLKGSNRPIYSEDMRRYMLENLKAVDYVVIFDEDTPIKTIEALRPDIHVKGGDYRKENLPETKIVEAYGGQVVIIDSQSSVSTTEIIGRIRQYG